MVRTLGVRVRARGFHFANAIIFIYVVPTANDREVGEIICKNIIPVVQDRQQCSLV